MLPVIIRTLPLLLGIFLLGIPKPIQAQLVEDISLTPKDSASVQMDSLQVASDSLLLTDAQRDSLMRDSLSQAWVLIDSLERERGIQQESIAQMEALINRQQEAIEALRETAFRRLRYEQFTGTYRGNYGNWQFHSCRINPENAHIELFNQKKKGKKPVHTFGSVAQLAQEAGQSLRFAMNAGMYERDRSAKGLLIMEGEQYQELDTLRKGYGNFYMQPNGVFALDSQNRAYVLTTQAYQEMADSVSFRIATQSGPMMVVQGEINRKFNDGSPNRHIRNAVGVTPMNEVIFAISTRPVTFFELSSYMIEQGCTDVLYLDGAISEAYMPDLGRNSLQAGNGLGPIVVIRE